MSDVPDRGLDVPGRRVVHDFDDDDQSEFGALIGEAQTLPMDAVARAQARQRRERLEQLGGFGFGKPV